MNKIMKFFGIESLFFFAQLCTEIIEKDKNENKIFSSLTEK